MYYCVCEMMHALGGLAKKVQGEPLKAEFREKHVSKAAPWAYEYIAKGMRASVLGGTCKALNRAGRVRPYRSGLCPPSPAGHSAHPRSGT